VAKKCIDGNPENIHRRFKRESHPIKRHGLPKGMVRPCSDWIVPSKRMLLFCCDLTPA
jgi:hypothetical protein